MNKIILKLQGGLGNQLFQYAFGKTVQQNFGANLVLDISDFQYDKAGRKYALEPFNIDYSVVEIDDTGRYNILYDQRKNWLIKLGVKLAPELLYRIAAKFGVYIWEEIKFHPVTINKDFERICIHGLWQSEKYFNEIGNILKEELKIKHSPSEEDKNLISLIRNMNSVCVHIRRGDFLKNSNNLYNCTEEYYKKAMSYIEKNVISPVFYIFSDDINDVKKNFKFGGKDIVYIEEKRSDYEEFRIMYNCKNFIISNSTFSWWASYLREGDGIVIAPRKWYTDKTDISDLVRKDMILL